MGGRRRRQGEHGGGGGGGGGPGPRRGVAHALRRRGRLRVVERGRRSVLHRRKILTVTDDTAGFPTSPPRAAAPQRPPGSYELVRAIASDDDKGDDLDGALTVEDDFDDGVESDPRRRDPPTWCSSSRASSSFESDPSVARAALRRDVDRDRRALRRASRRSATVPAMRGRHRPLGRGGDQTSRVLGAGVVKRREGRLLPVAVAPDRRAERPRDSSTYLPRFLLKKAKISETTLRLTVLGLTTDAARFADGSEGHQARSTRPRRP